MKSYWSILIEDIRGEHLLSNGNPIQFDSFELAELYRYELSIEHCSCVDSDRTWSCSTVFVESFSESAIQIKDELGAVVLWVNNKD